MNRILKALMVTLLIAATARAEVSVGASNSLFDKGKVRATVSAGWGQAFNQDYVILGGGMGYFITRGLELGVDGEAWMGSSPHFQKLTPEVRYIFQGIRSLYPYIGTFYRRIFYEDFDDTDSFGGRFGLYAPMGNNIYLGGGAVVEKQIDCDDSIYDHCTAVYPEFSITFAF